MENTDSDELRLLRKELNEVKNRLKRVESALWEEATKEPLQFEKNQKETIILAKQIDDKKSLELRAGEYGMAWLGNIVLLFGFIFLIKYLSNNPFISFIVGATAVTGIYVASFFTRNSFAYLSRLFSYSGHLLLYYIVVSLHFFQAEPLIDTPPVALGIQVLVLGSFFYIAFKRKSRLMSTMVLLMMLASGVISNSVSFLAATGTVVTLLSMWLYYKYGWIKLVFAFIFLIYMTHLCWLLNNPIMNLKIELLESPGINYIQLFASGFIFSLVALLPPHKKTSNEILIAATIWNGLGFTFNLTIATIFYYASNFVPLYASIAIFCLIYSVILQLKSAIKITASMYALYGFLALSVALYGIFFFPRTFMFLAIESLLVVSMALWFRSRFIVIINSILFLVLLIVYLSTPSNNGNTDFAFMLTAFLTARVINWKKERLNIQTEMMRNFYLLAGFTMTLVALYHSVSNSFITVSWIFAAILFFAMSLLLKNFKYRWLAIATMIATTIKLIFADMSNIDIGYRVLIFLVFAIIAITVSILYTKFFRKKEKQETDS